MKIINRLILGSLLMVCTLHGGDMKRKGFFPGTPKSSRPIGQVAHSHSEVELLRRQLLREQYQMAQAGENVPEASVAQEPPAQIKSIGTQGLMPEELEPLAKPPTPFFIKLMRQKDQPGGLEGFFSRLCLLEPNINKIRAELEGAGRYRDDMSILDMTLQVSLVLTLPDMAYGKMLTCEVVFDELRTLHDEELLALKHMLTAEQSLEMPDGTAWDNIGAILSFANKEQWDKVLIRIARKEAFSPRPQEFVPIVEPLAFAAGAAQPSVWPGARLTPAFQAYTESAMYNDLSPEIKELSTRLNKAVAAWKGISYHPESGEASREVVAPLVRQLQQALVAEAGATNKPYMLEQNLIPALMTHLIDRPSDPWDRYSFVQNSIGQSVPAMVLFNGADKMPLGEYGGTPVVFKQLVTNQQAKVSGLHALFNALAFNRVWATSYSQSGMSVPAFLGQNSAQIRAVAGDMEDAFYDVARGCINNKKIINPEIMKMALECSAIPPLRGFSEYAMPLAPIDDTNHDEMVAYIQSTAAPVMIREGIYNFIMYIADRQEWVDISLARDPKTNIWYIILLDPSNKPFVAGDEDAAMISSYLDVLVELIESLGVERALPGVGEPSGSHDYTVTPI